MAATSLKNILKTTSGLQRAPANKGTVSGRTSNRLRAKTDQVQRLILKLQLLEGAQSTVWFSQTVWCCLNYLSRVFNMQLFGFQLRAITRKWKLALKIFEITCLYRNTSQCALQASGNALHLLPAGRDKFKQLREVFMGDGRQNKVDARIGKTNTVLRELYRSVVKKGELSNTAKLSVFE